METSLNNFTGEQLRNYEKYYKTQLAKAQLYQDFVVDVCWNVLGLAIVMYTSREYQMAVGESKTGVEIKNDSKYCETGNVFIETAERRPPRVLEYVPSGIFREDNSWLYIVGDYDTIYIFSKRLLRALSKMQKNGKPVYPIREIGMKTSKGFCIPKSDAEKYCVEVLTPNAAQKVLKFTGDLIQMAKALSAAITEDVRQVSLFDNGNNHTDNNDSELPF